mgnify:CR=1 FL=1
MKSTTPNRLERMQERQKLHNDKTKYWAAVIGQNMSLAVCFMIPVLLVTLIWTETTLPKLGASLAMETFLTAALFIFAEWSAINVGVPSGKLDDDYLAIQAAFKKRKAEVKARGILKMGVFCDWQIDEELIGAKKILCRKLKIDWKLYKNELSKMNEKELIDTFGKKRGGEIHSINALEPIELTPELILGDGQGNFRGGISISGDEYVSRQKTDRRHIITSILTIVLTVGVGFIFSPGVTWGKIVFTIYRLIAVFIRMKVGFDKGARAYNHIEVKHRESQIFYMDKYDEFLDTDGLYEAVAEKYSDSGIIVPTAERRENIDTEVSRQLCPTDQEGSGAGQTDRELHAAAGADF